MSFSQEIRDFNTVQPLHSWEVRDAVVDHVYSGVNNVFERFPEYTASNPFVMQLNEDYPGERMFLAGPDAELVILTRPIGTETKPDIEIRRIYVKSPDDPAYSYIVGSGGDCHVTTLNPEPLPPVAPRVDELAGKFTSSRLWDYFKDDLADKLGGLDPRRVSRMGGEMLAFLLYPELKDVIETGRCGWVFEAVKNSQPLPSHHHAESLGRLISGSIPLLPTVARFR